MSNFSSIFKTGLLFALLTALLVFVGYLVGGTNGAYLFLGIGIVINLVSFWFSDKIALAMNGAKEVSESQAPQLYADIRELTAKMGLPMPRIYISPAQQPNAFATGRDPHHAAVCVTQGILQVLNNDELRGVLAHELSHVKNRDVLTATIAAVIGGTISGLAQIGYFFGTGSNNRRSVLGDLLLIILAPLAAGLIQMAISRTREFEADRSGALVTGKPQDLAEALIKIHQIGRQIPLNVNPAFSSLYIAAPFSRRSFANLFSTHPSLEDRVAKLMELKSHTNS